MRCLLALLTLLVLLPLFGSGCALDIDSDSLVRELRVLAIRIGDPEPGSEADVQATVSLSGGGDLVFTRDHVDLAVLVAAPTGPGRRIPSPRPLRHDWYLCVGLASLTVPGTLDPACNKFLPTDPPPEKNPALLPLGSGERLRLPTAVLKEVIGRLLQAQVFGSGGSGGGGADMGTGSPMLPTQPLTLPLPVIVRTSAVGGDPRDSRDSEAAFGFVRTIVALPGMDLPAPNHNPTFRAMTVGPSSRETEGGSPMQPLMPCSPQGMLDGTCARYTLGREETAFLVGTVQDGSLERYTPLDASGRPELTERMRYSWFATDGEFKEERTGDALPENQWKSEGKRPAPPEVSVVPLWFVLQDERGGADWAAFELQLKP
jgi:hypothetical protein